MSDPDFIIRKYSPEDLPQILELLDHVFDGWPKVDHECSKKEYWNWKYRDRPCQVLEATVAVDGEKIVGCIHSANVYLKVKNHIYLSEPKGDLAVHPDYRGRGIWTQMVGAWYDNMWSENLVNYNNSSNPIVVGKVRKNKGLTLPSTVRHFSRISDISEYLEAKKFTDPLVKRMGYHGLKSLSTLRNILSDNQSTKHDYKIRTITRFYEDIDLFWDHVKEDYEFIVERKQEYLNWRYCNPRGGKYVVRLLENSEGIKGYSVLRINRINPGFPEGYIVDLVTARDDTDAASALLADATKFFDKANINAVHIWAPEDNFIVKVLDKMGFINTQVEVVVYFGSRGKPEILRDVRECEKDRVMFQLGDVDWI